MRRVLAIGLAIIIVTLGARGAVAQDSQADVSERLLEILKDRQIISEDEYGELKTLASQMQDERAETDERLTELDRSISDYLAQGGDATGANAAYKKRDGFGLMTGDGLFAMYVGGLFQFGYSGRDFDDLSGVRDSNSFNVSENRFHFLGHAFDPNLRYYVEFNGDGGVVLLDAFINYEAADYANLRVGQYKVPFGRQAMTYVGDRQFFSQNPTSAMFDFGRDVGIMLWDIMEVDDGGTVVEWYAHAGNGDGPGSSVNEGPNLQWVLRLGVYPMGYVGNADDPYGRNYVEADMDGNDDPKIGIAASYLSNKNSDTGSIRGWEIDAVFTMGGIFLMGEFMNSSFNPKATGAGSTDGWYLQGGFMVPDSQIELVARYGVNDLDKNFGTGADKTVEWSLGVVYYWDGHFWKVGAFLTHLRTSTPVAKNWSMDALSFVFQLDW